jgi:hypothetical protein
MTTHACEAETNCHDSRGDIGVCVDAVDLEQLCVMTQWESFLASCFSPMDRASRMTSERV